MARFTWRHGRKIAAVAFVLAISSLGAWASNQRQANEESESIGRRKQTLQKVNQITAVATRVRNSEGAPLVVLESKSKEITAKDYFDLLGVTSVDATYASLPEVSLVNNGYQEITGMMVVVWNQRTGMAHAIVKPGMSLAPGETFHIAPHQWVLTKLKKRGDSMGQKELRRLPDWTAPEMWQLGRSDDLVVTVSVVRFADGTKWEEPAAETIGSSATERADFAGTK